MVDANTENVLLRSENEILREALLIEAKKLVNAYAQIARLKAELEVTRGNFERVMKERDEAVARVGERDRQILVMQEV